jgi:hypothetical protein
MPELINRRNFLGAAAATCLSQWPRAKADSLPATKPAHPQPLVWACLVHLTDNMWCDWDAPGWGANHGVYRPTMQFDDQVWSSLLEPMAQAGVNMVVMDLGDGVKYESHPEIAVKDAWSVNRLKTELARLRKLGLEPIPKLNFSTTHDTWLGPYSRCVSTDTYYGVCRDLIAEVIDIFDKPRFFHLGMDEETAEHQTHYQYVVLRQYDLWWKDFYFYVEQITKGGSRPWIWSDYVWNHPDDFFRKMPRTVLQSNWYYGTDFDINKRPVKVYDDLNQHGYDQIPTGSNWSSPLNFGLTVKYCQLRLKPEHLLGFLQTVWMPMLHRQRFLDAIEQVRRARQ